MTRGDLFRVRTPPSDPKRNRVYVVVSRPALLVTTHSTVVCAPVLTSRAGLETQVDVGVEDGLKHDSSVHCDALVSVPKAALTDYLSHLSPDKVAALDQALRVALALE